MIRRRSKHHRSPTAAKAQRLFVTLSEILTGGQISRRTAMRHLATLRAALGSAAIQALLKKFQSLESSSDLVRGVAEEIVADPVFGPIVKAVTLLWFTGVVSAPNGVPAAATQEDYFEALMWSAVGAHPPAFSDGYFGHWRYPPDEGG